MLGLRSYEIATHWQCLDPWFRFPNPNIMYIYIFFYCLQVRSGGWTFSHKFSFLALSVQMNNIKNPKIMDIFFLILFFGLFYFFIFFSRLLRFLIIWNFHAKFWTYFWIFWILFKFTKVTRNIMGLLQNAKNGLKLAETARKASAKGRSPLQEIEVSPRSDLYLLVQY